MQIPNKAINPIPAEMEKLKRVINSAAIPLRLQMEHSEEQFQHLWHWKTA